MDLFTISLRIASNKLASDMTVGDLKEAIRILQKSKPSDKVKEVSERVARAGVKSAMKALIGLVPGGGTVSALIDGISLLVGKDPYKNIIDGLFKKVINKPDSKSKKNPILRALNVDDEYESMLDSKVIDQFAQKFINDLEGLDESSPIPNANDALETFVNRKFDGHGIMKFDEE